MLMVKNNLHRKVLTLSKSHATTSALKPKQPITHRIDPTAPPKNNLTCIISKSRAPLRWGDEKEFKQH